MLIRSVLIFLVKSVGHVTLSRREEKALLGKGEKNPTHRAKHHKSVFSAFSFPFIVKNTTRHFVLHSSPWLFCHKFQYKTNTVIRISLPGQVSKCTLFGERAQGHFQIDSAEKRARPTLSVGEVRAAAVLGRTGYPQGAGFPVLTERRR